jgi:hypothetical protein
MGVSDPLGEVVMRHILFVAVGIAAIGLASPAAAQNSPCAVLPQAGPVPNPNGGTEVSTPPQIAFNGAMSCPAGSRLVTGNGPPRCVRTLPTVVQGNPQAECYAGLPFGPVSMVDKLARPIAGQCATRVNNIPIRGRGVGFNDVVVTLVPMTGTAMTRLVDPLPAQTADSPVDQRCLGPDCRLMQLTTTAETPQSAVLSIGLPGRPPVTRTLNFARSCPKPPNISKCPPLGGTSPGSTPSRNCP